MTDQDATSLARLSLHDAKNFHIQYTQTLHRLNLLQHWNISPGDKILELGCGQGDCTTVLANAVGEEGKIIALDPADLEYGSPYTLGQSQHHISQSSLGNRISFFQQSPLPYLASSPEPFSATVLAHSLWYFSSPELLLSTFLAIKRNSPSLFLAEWSLSSSLASAQPHIFAVLAQAALESWKNDSTSNVRTVLSPKRITQLAISAGWKLESEGLVKTGELKDGVWEVSAVLDKGFEGEVERVVKGERDRAVVLALRDACEDSLKSVEGGLKGVTSMDVWVARFV